MKIEFDELFNNVAVDGELREEHAELGQSLAEVDGKIAQLAKSKSPKKFDDADRRAFATLRDRRELIPLRQQRIDEELQANDAGTGEVLVRLKMSASRTTAQLSKEVEASIREALSKEHFSKEEATRIAAESIGRSTEPRLAAARRLEGMLWRVKTGGDTYDGVSRVEIAKTVLQFAKANGLLA